MKINLLILMCLFLQSPIEVLGQDKINHNMMILEKTKKNGKTKEFIIRENKRIGIKTDSIKLRGKFNILNDSTIAIGETEICIADITRVQRYKPSHNTGIFTALALPGTAMVIMGGYIAVDADSGGGWVLLAGGIAIPITGTILMGLKGKDYQMKKQNSSVKWNIRLGDN